MIEAELQNWISKQLEQQHAEISQLGASIGIDNEGIEAVDQLYTSLFRYNEAAFAVLRDDLKIIRDASTDCTSVAKTTADTFTEAYKCIKGKRKVRNTIQDGALKTWTTTNLGAAHFKDNYLAFLKSLINLVRLTLSTASTTSKSSIKIVRSTVKTIRAQKSDI